MKTLISKLDDCDYIAADSEEQAREHFKQQYGQSAEECEQIDSSCMMNKAEQGRPPVMVTMQDQIDLRLAAGERLPFVVAIDGHYA